MSDSLAVLSRSATCALGTFGAVVIIVFRGRVLPDDVRAVRAALRALANERGEAVALLDVVAAGTRPPDDEARSIFRAAMTEDVDVLARAAVVPEGAGMFSALVRSVVTGLVFVARPPFPVEVHANVAGACDWLGGGAALTAAAAELRVM